MGDELLEVLSFPRSNLGLDDILETVDDAFHVLDQHVVASDDDCVVLNRLGLSGDLFLALLSVLLQGRQVRPHDVVQSPWDHVVLEQKLVDEALNRLLVVKELFIVLSASGRVDSNKLAFPLVLHQGFSEDVFVAHSGQLGQHVLCLLGLTQISDHSLHLFDGRSESEQFVLTHLRLAGGRLQTHHRSSFGLVRSFDSILHFVHGLLAAVKALDSCQVEGVCNQLGFDGLVQRMITCQTGRKVDM